MPATSLRVSLLSVTPNAEALVYAAMRQCYSEEDASDIFKDMAKCNNAIISTSDGIADLKEQKKCRKFINKVMESGHESPIEHVSLSFAVVGVSRALSHQLVRHRIASYSQQSQRYVDAAAFDYVLPPAVAAIPEAKAAFEAAMDRACEAYAALQEILSRHGRGNKANEDARFVLPNACETKICVTMNARSLLHFFEQRCCFRAQWEIRALANEMLRLCKDAVPVIFEKAGARCERKGFCEEEKGCGRYPKLKDVMEKYKEDASCAS